MLVDRVESLLDLLVGPRLVAVDRLGVEAEQDRNAVARSSGDLGSSSRALSATTLSGMASHSRPPRIGLI
ncbi:hypothetical protein ACFY1B_36760 [Streptomyces mirabilis]|uniref:hypothetical protein n=1 Tax=Streptomyces mirabilis TaxID=68239 RepID=UPI00367F6127